MIRKSVARSRIHNLRLVKTSASARNSLRETMYVQTQSKAVSKRWKIKDRVKVRINTIIIKTSTTYPPCFCSWCHCRLLYHDPRPVEYKK